MKLRLPVLIAGILLNAAIAAPQAFSQEIDLLSITNPLPPLESSSETVYSLKANLAYSFNSALSKDSVFVHRSMTEIAPLVFQSATGARYDLSFDAQLSSGVFLGAISSGLASSGSYGGKITFRSLGNISFSGYVSNHGGGAVYSHSLDENKNELEGGVSFDNIVGNIRFLNNSATVYGYGGAIYSYTQLGYRPGTSSAQAGTSFTQVNGNIEFSGNHATKSGGGIYESTNTGINTTNAIATITGGVKFSGVNGNVSFSENIAAENGGGIFGLAYGDTQKKGTSTVESYILFESVSGNVSFANNEAVNGAAIGAEAGSQLIDLMSGVGTIGITDSTVFRNIGGTVLFSKNKASGAGGAIAAFVSGNSEGPLTADTSILFENLSGDVIFTANEAKGNGGAIAEFPTVRLWAGSFEWNSEVTFRNIAGGVLFENNSAVGNGGAIYSIGMSSTRAQVTNSGVISFSRISEGVLFSGNHSKGLGGAIYSEKSGILLSADGGDITFKNNTMGDGTAEISNAVYITNSGADGSLTEFRAQKDRTVAFYDSVVILAGDTSMDWNKTVSENGGETVYGGRILFSGSLTKDSIVRISGETDADYANRLKASRTSNIVLDSVLHDGMLHVADEAVVRIKSLTVNDAELKTTNKGLIVSTSDIALNNARLDIKGIMTGNGPVALDLPGSLTGNVYFLDKDGDLYTNSALLGTTKTVAILTLESDGSNYSGLSLTPGGVVEYNGYGNQGYWTLDWDVESTTAGDPAHTLYAIWTKTGFLVDPQKKGTAALNSLWSSKSNVNTFTTSALGQVGAARFYLPKDSNIWAMGLGDFGMQRSEGGIDGYDYWGGGYAVGADTKVAQNVILGIAFGQLVGTNQGRDIYSTIDQDSLMGAIYGSALQKLDNWNALRYEAAVSYGVTSNKMDTLFTDGGSAYGKWDNNTWEAVLRLNWDTALGEKWILTPFIGLEYTHTEMDSFTESGSDARVFDKAELGNLALPVGIGVSNTSDISGMRWDNSISLSYVPDVYRDNPSAAVRFVGGTDIWNARGISTPRNSGRLNVYTRLQLTEAWATYAGYQLDVRDRGLDQRVNLGASYAF